MSDILIVDDERDIRELISEILIDEGYTTRVAGTSEDAMREVTEQPPSLLILDIWLKDSDMDGIDILKKVKLDYPEVPVRPSSSISSPLPPTTAAPSPSSLVLRKVLQKSFKSSWFCC